MDSLLFGGVTAIYVGAGGLYTVGVLQDSAGMGDYIVVVDSVLVAIRSGMHNVG